MLDPATPGLAPMAELLLYFADRAQHVAEVIRPALADGRIVLCDRHVESSLAYQGYGRGLPLDAIRALGALATGGLRPDLIVLARRAGGAGPAAGGPARGRRTASRRRSLAFHERVRAGYEALAAEEPARWLRARRRRGRRGRLRGAVARARAARAGRGARRA